MMQKLIVMNEKDYRQLIAKPQEPSLSLTALPNQHATLEPLVKERERLGEHMAESQGKIPSDVKYDQFQQDLRRYLLMHDKMQQPMPIPIVKVTPPSQQQRTSSNKLPLNLQGLTQRQRELADVLVNHLVFDNPDVNWNARGELIVDDQVIANSNMTDIIHDLVRTRRNVPPPLGFAQLAIALVRHNAPREAIANLARRQAIFNPPQQGQQQQYADDGEENFEDTFADFGSQQQQQQGLGLLNFKALY
jgi:hypothetical protein